MLSNSGSILYTESQCTIRYKSQASLHREMLFPSKTIQVRPFWNTLYSDYHIYSTTLLLYTSPTTTSASRCVTEYTSTMSAHAAAAGFLESGISDDAEKPDRGHKMWTTVVRMTSARKVRRPRGWPGHTVGHVLKSTMSGWDDGHCSEWFHLNQQVLVLQRHYSLDIE